MHLLKKEIGAAIICLKFYVFLEKLWLAGKVK